MLGLIGVFALLIVLGLTFVITRLATIALTLTGLSEEVARFQARSAFTGTGFTTSESENVVDHPVRRRIIMLLIVLRSAGLITIVISLILSFGDQGDITTHLTRLALLAGGVLVLVLLANSRLVNRWLTRVMRWALQRWTDLDARDYAGLLKLSDGYTVMELQVGEDDWLSWKKLSQCDLNHEGVTVLGIQRKGGKYVGGPTAQTVIYPGDIVILYGQSVTLRELDARRPGSAGEAAHRESIRSEEQRLIQQEHEESQHRRAKTLSTLPADSQDKQRVNSGRGNGE